MKLQADDSGQLVLMGELTFDTVPDIYRSTRHLQSADELFESVDLSAVERVDSAGLALLLEWQSAAHANGRTLRFDKAPAALIRLAALCEADTLLGLEQKQEGNDG